MKRLLLIAIAFFTLNAVAQEKKTKSATLNKEQHTKQQHSSPEEMATMKTKKLSQQLDLTSNQQKEVYNLILEYAKGDTESKLKIKEEIASKDKIDMQEAKKSYIINREKQMDQMNSKFKDILNDEQHKKYEKISSKSQGKRKKH
jgi:protein CpxP